MAIVDCPVDQPGRETAGRFARHGMGGAPIQAKTRPCFYQGSSLGDKRDAGGVGLLAPFMARDLRS